MNTAQLYAKYYSDGWMPREVQPLEIVESDATTQVLPYSQWCRLKCACCGKVGNVSGVWQCQFSNCQQVMLMCAPCAFYDAFAKWTGFFSRKIIRIDLISTLTFPSRTE